MSGQTFNTFLWAWIVLALALAPIQFRVTAPYGRHASTKWGPTIPNRLGWLVMEAVSPLVFAAALLLQNAPIPTAVWVFAGLYLGHYFNRAFLFPLRTRTMGKRIPLAIVVSAIAFNTVNGWANGYYLGSGLADYAGWIADPRFWLGLFVFFAGAAINLWADNRLIGLRSRGETGYAIPRGGPFDLVSCPNHLGEIIEWTGFAICCWNLPALAFAVWTAANLVPRALSHHRWYKEEFADYPSGRMALVPYML